MSHRPAANKTPHDGGRKRTPNGIDPRPVALRLMPEEREEVEALSAEANVTMAAFSRECFVVGLAEIKKRQAAVVGKRGR